MRGERVRFWVGPDRELFSPTIKRVNRHLTNATFNVKAGEPDIRVYLPDDCEESFTCLNTILERDEVSFSGRELGSRRGVIKRGAHPLQDRHSTQVRPENLLSEDRDSHRTDAIDVAYCVKDSIRRLPLSMPRNLNSKITVISSKPLERRH